MFNCMLSDTTVFAGEFLEARGYRFGQDYGITNAISKATDIMLGLEEEDQGYGHAI
jgi:hypothetical protein